MPPRSPATRSEVDLLRAALVAAGRRLGARGLVVAGEGNVSVRLREGLLITPAAYRKDELDPSDIVRVDLDGDVGSSGGGARPSSDLAIHRAVYAARPDVLAVAHAHLPAAMALTLAGEVPDPAVLPETAVLLPRIPFVPFGQPGSAELATRVATALAEPPLPLPGAVLLERHGAVAVGGADSLKDGAESAEAAARQALDRLELVEVLCRTWRDALLISAAATGRDTAAILRPPSPSPGSSAPKGSRRTP
jgi:ribulose-5-phosphate 4-epimerase/fuculose-1-phosphate aldolase